MSQRRRFPQIRAEPIQLSRRESQAALKSRTVALIKLLKELYPDAHCELDFRNPFELLCATILSAQCTDVRVNLVSPGLFKRWPDASALALASQSDVEDVIRSTGFFRNKAKSLIGMAQAVVANHGGDIPRTMVELRPIPGIGRKTANCVLGNAYGLSEGITVDTHVIRLASLLRLSREADPEKLEQALMKIVPREEWVIFSHLIIWHGRRVCIANRPKCAECALTTLCPSAFK